MPARMANVTGRTRGPVAIVDESHVRHATVLEQVVRPAGQAPERAGRHSYERNVTVDEVLGRGGPMDVGIGLPATIPGVDGKTLREWAL